MWEAASGLTFEDISSGQADIYISFEQGDHGDTNAFDGPGGSLGHAFYIGDIHIDDSDDWSVTPFVGTRLLSQFTHLIGHSLGLRHSTESDSVMDFFYKGWDINFRLSQGDREAIQELYGKP